MNAKATADRVSIPITTDRARAISWLSFNDARDWAAEHAKGWPAWRVRTEWAEGGRVVYRVDLGGRDVGPWVGAPVVPQVTP